MKLTGLGWIVVLLHPTFLHASPECVRALFPGDGLAVEGVAQLPAPERRERARQLAEKIAVEWGQPKTAFTVTQDGRFLVLRMAVSGSMIHYEFWDLTTGEHPYRVSHPYSRSHMPKALRLYEGEVVELDEGSGDQEYLVAAFEDLDPIFYPNGYSIDGRKFADLDFVSESVETVILDSLSAREAERLTLKLSPDGNYIVSSPLRDPLDEARSSSIVRVWDKKTGELAYIVEFKGHSGQGTVFKTQGDGNDRRHSSDYTWNKSRKNLKPAD